MPKEKLIVILGQTASGKTDLSIKLAKKFSGQIICADSRQVYRGLDIGSGKITKSQMQGIPHHLLDVANPKRRFTVAQYQKLALKAIKQVQAKGKLPFLVGGTGFYIQSIVEGLVIPEVPPNAKLRKILEKKSTQELFLMLQKVDPARSKNIDQYNPRRLMRAIEIALADRRPTSIKNKLTPVVRGRTPYNFEVLQIGIKKSPEELKVLIQKRLQKRIKSIIAEVKKLHTQGLSYKRLEELGLEYRYVAQYLQNNVSYQEMIDNIQKGSEHFAKRQMTWFKRDKRIHWINNYQEAKKLLQKHT